MSYAYYPGCSLTESACEFDVSTRAVMEHLGQKLIEVPNWTCCGASAAEPVSELMNYVLPARNLAIVENDMDGVDVLVPCSACYLNLLKVNREVVGDRHLHARVNEVLAASGLIYSGKVSVRHLLDALLNDVGAKIMEQKVTSGLEGMNVAPYYGCQILRPYPVFDDPGKPTSMEPIIRAMGGKVHSWDQSNRCCGASLMMGHPEVALQSVADILHGAEGADVIVTVCPLCQMNLEAYQDQVIKAGGSKVPVLYLTQLMGLAFGMTQEAMHLDKNLTMTAGVRKCIAEKPWSRVAPEDGGEEAVGAEKINPNKGVTHV